MPKCNEKLSLSSKLNLKMNKKKVDQQSNESYSSRSLPQNSAENTKETVQYSKEPFMVVPVENKKRSNRTDLIEPKSKMAKQDSDRCLTGADKKTSGKSLDEDLEDYADKSLLETNGELAELESTIELLPLDSNVSSPIQPEPIGLYSQEGTCESSITGGDLTPSLEVDGKLLPTSVSNSELLPPEGTTTTELSDPSASNDDMSQTETNNNAATDNGNMDSSTLVNELPPPGGVVRLGKATDGGLPMYINSVGRTFAIDLTEEAKDYIRDLAEDAKKGKVATVSKLKYLTMQALEQIIKYNDRPLYNLGGHPQLAAVVADYIKNGVPPRCPLCKRGALRFSNGKKKHGKKYYWCPGYSPNGFHFYGCNFKAEREQITLIPFAYPD